MKFKLTDLSIKNAKPREKAYKLTDGGGLYVLVKPQGGKLWRMKYYFGGTERLLALGQYPHLSIAKARRKWEKAKELLAQGIDPNMEKKEIKAIKAVEQAHNLNTFELIAREWFSKFSTGWSTSNKKKVLARLVNDIFPFLGNSPITEIKAPGLLEALRKIENRGAVETAHRALSDCSRIFRYAIATGRAERDPAADLRGAIPPAEKTHFATIIDPKEIRQLLLAIDEYRGRGYVVSYALALVPLLFLRHVELRELEWQEVNFEKEEIRIPAIRMKMNSDHIVPLSRQSMQILKELYPYTCNSKYVFPGFSNKGKPISEGAMRNALRSIGYKSGKMTIHGFRHMASTLLNEMGYNRDWIERQLSHGDRNIIRATYNYAEYLPERRKMMQAWANYLDGLRADSGNI